VIALAELKCTAAQLGLFFTCVAVGSLAGAILVLPYLRKRTSPNVITSIAMGMAAVVLLALALVRNPPALMITLAMAGVAWAMAASEFWLAGQRVTPAWVRGRLNALIIMVGQGGIALGSVLLGAGAAQAGLNLTLSVAATLAFIGLGVGYRFSIDFDSRGSVDAAPLNPLCRSVSLVRQDDRGAVENWMTSLSRIANCSKRIDDRNPLELWTRRSRHHRGGR
jgi:Transmembrane secretion effector